MPIFVGNVETFEWLTCELYMVNMMRKELGYNPSEWSMVQTSWQMYPAVNKKCMLLFEYN